jgi:hypothetical protein
MLRILGRRNRLCDGIERREFMRVGGLSLFGGMNWLQAARAANAGPAVHGPAKSADRRILTCSI